MHGMVIIVHRRLNLRIRAHHDRMWFIKKHHRRSTRYSHDQHPAQYEYLPFGDFLFGCSLIFRLAVVLGHMEGVLAKWRRGLPIPRQDAQ